MEKVSQALKEEMARRRHSLRQAALAMGVTPTTVNNWVKGWIVKQPHLEHIDALAGYLGVPRYVILGWFDWLNGEQVELLSTIPGLLVYAEGLALSMATRAGYLNSADSRVLVAS